jgi:hypothetical protein
MTPGIQRTRRLVAIGLLVVVGAFFVLSAASRIAAPFADSDEGINGAVWGQNSRALRELGPIDSRLGAVRDNASTYATHPPAIVVEAAAFESVLGEHPWVTRAPAWIATLVSIALLWLLARELTDDTLVAGAATFAATCSHMVFTYGPMLDTMVTALPFALGVALVWVRTWRSEPVPRPAAVFALSLAAALCSWQAIFLLGLCGLSLAWRDRRSPAGAARSSWPYLTAAAVGTVVTVAWGWWAYGSLSVLRDKLLRRSGESSGTSLGDMVSFQLPWLAQLLGFGLLALVVCVVALRLPRYRPLAAVSLLSVFAYAAVFREGSGGHQYWNYWAIVPAMVGFAVVFDTVARSSRQAGAHGAAAIAIIVVLAGLIGVVNLTRPAQAADLIVDGQRPYDLLTAPDALAPGQATIPYVAEPYRIDDWVRYNRLPSPVPLLDRAQLERLAAERPDDRVLVLGTCLSPDPTGICVPLTFGDRPDVDAVPPRFVAASELTAELR